MYCNWNCIKKGIIFVIVVHMLIVILSGCSSNNLLPTGGGELTLEAFTQGLNTNLQLQGSNTTITNAHWILQKEDQQNKLFLLHIDTLGEKGGILAIVEGKKQKIASLTFTSNKFSSDGIVVQQQSTVSQNLETIMKYIKLALPLLDEDITPRRAEELFYGTWGGFNNGVTYYKNYHFSTGPAILSPLNEAITLSVASITTQEKEERSKENPGKLLIQLDAIYSMPSPDKDQDAIDLAGTQIDESYTVLERYILNDDYTFPILENYSDYGKYAPIYQLRAIFQPPSGYQGVVYRLSSSQAHAPDYLVLENGNIYQFKSHVTSENFIIPESSFDCFVPINLSEDETKIRNKQLIEAANKQVDILEDTSFFWVTGEITSLNQDGSMNIWGMARPNNGGWGVQGALHSQTNILVVTPDASCVVGNVYYNNGKHGFERKDIGSNRLGSSVPVYVYGNMPIEYQLAEKNYKFISQIINALIAPVKVITPIKVEEDLTELYDVNDTNEEMAEASNTNQIEISPDPDEKQGATPNLNQPAGKILSYSLQHGADTSILSSIEIKSITGNSKNGEFLLSIQYKSLYDVVFSISDSPHFIIPDMNISEQSLYLSKQTSSYTFHFNQSVIDPIDQLTLEVMLDITDDPQAMEIYQQGMISIRFDIQI